MRQLIKLVINHLYFRMWGGGGVRALNCQPRKLSVVCISICSICASDEVEYEYHFLLKCNIDRGPNVTPSPFEGLFTMVIFEVSEYGRIDIRLFEFKLL